MAFALIHIYDQHEVKGKMVGYRRSAAEGVLRTLKEQPGDMSIEQLK